MSARKSLSQRILTTILALLLAGCATGPMSLTPAAPGRASRLPDPNEVRALLAQIVDVEKQVPGIVVGMIAADPQESWVVGYGRLSATDERVPDGDTVYEIGSVTKLFTGTLLAQAVLKGEVQLDDPISLYLPEGVSAPMYEGQTITLLDLATHTSGLPRDLSSITSFDQMFDYLSSYRLPGAPGSNYQYSNYGMGLLGNLLALHAGQPDYEALLLERICLPLGMDSTRIELTPEMQARLAAPHTGTLSPTNLWSNPAQAAGGMIRSTAHDLLTFLAANMGLIETDLGPALQLANTPQRPSNGNDRVGLGWQVAAYSGLHFHSGATNGSNSHLTWDPKQGYGMVVLTNAARDVDPIARMILSRMPTSLADEVPENLASYAGRYELADGNIVTIRVADSRIYIQLPTEPEYELYASSEDHFYMAVSTLEVRFYRDEGGNVQRAVGVVEGVSYEGIKLP